MKLSTTFNHLLIKLKEASHKKESEIVENILEDHRAALESAYSYIKSKLARKVQKFMKNPSLNKLQTSLAIRSMLDSMGYGLSLIHICRCRRYAVCRSRWSPYH
eukprot:TRINITY_DN15520_c0_g2_i1.p2 TRINITY_DN15520_c0_g2~~TRINITY_DN15520_c0_g2_i1.p2  ORF type:complete len:104 (-),score=23.67 TRINITY_DN15520_c0_g2_i1:14-325(-)